MYIVNWLSEGPGHLLDVAKSDVQGKYDNRFILANALNYCSFGQICPIMILLKEKAQSDSRDNWM